MSEAADYSFARPSPVALAAAGYKDVLRYVSTPGNTKNITPDEVQALQDAGLGIALTWETVNQRAATSGAAGGTTDAPLANQMADALGYPPSCVIYFVLEDPNPVPPSTWPQIDAYAQAAKQSSSRPIGGYGSQAYLEHAIDLGLISKGWQVGGWSTDVSSKCHLLQRSANPALTTMGGAVDDNLIIVEDFGQWTGSIGPSPSPVIPVPVPAPPGRAPDGNPFTILVVDGIFGDHTIRATQWKIGTPADGLFGSQSSIALQNHLGVLADGVIGPQTIKALQARVGAAQDGIWGSITTEGLQSHLNAATF
jgi:peptidoglycan hydrolase-like protein with peptidoglycan-binding domain